MAKLSKYDILTLAIKGRQNIVVANTAVIFNDKYFPLVIKEKDKTILWAGNNNLTGLDAGWDIFVDFFGQKSKSLVKRVNFVLPLLGCNHSFVVAKDDVYLVKDGKFILVDVNTYFLVDKFAGF